MASVLVVEAHMMKSVESQDMTMEVHLATRRKAIQDIMVEIKMSGPVTMTVTRRLEVVFLMMIPLEVNRPPRYRYIQRQLLTPSARRGIIASVSFKIVLFPDRADLLRNRSGDFGELAR